MLPKLSFLVVCLILLNGCIKSDFEPANHEQAASDLCASLERYSVSILRPNIDYVALKNEYLYSVNNGLSSQEFYDLTKSFLLNFEDPHIWLLSADENMYTLDNLGYARNINFTTIQSNYLENIQEHNESIISGTINDSIGYLYIANFKGENEGTETIFDEIIDDFSDKVGLIIDLRENDGGNVYNARSLLNRLTHQARLWHTTENRTVNGFDEKYEWYIAPEGSLQFQQEVVVLSGRFTVSAGERFIMGANLLPNTITIGDTTANTQGSVMGREMTNGWSYTFTFERVLSPAGTNYEGIGIAPDIYIPSNGLDLSTSDAILKQAILAIQ